MPDKSPLGWRWQKIHLSRSSLIQALTFASLGCVCFCETKWLHQMGVSQNFVPPIQPSTFSPWNSNFGFTPLETQPNQNPASSIGQPIKFHGWSLTLCMKPVSVTHLISPTDQNTFLIPAKASGQSLRSEVPFACSLQKSGHVSRSEVSTSERHGMPWVTSQLGWTRVQTAFLPSHRQLTFPAQTMISVDAIHRHRPLFFAEIVVLSLDCTETSKNQWLGSLGPSVSRCLKWSTEDTED
jgi:hypothetical protein